MTSLFLYVILANVFFIFVLGQDLIIGNCGDNCECIIFEKHKVICLPEQCLNGTKKMKMMHRSPGPEKSRRKRSINKVY